MPERKRKQIDEAEASVKRYLVSHYLVLSASSSFKDVDDINSYISSSLSFIDPHAHRGLLVNSMFSTRLWSKVFLFLSVLYGPNTAQNAQLGLPTQTKADFTPTRPCFHDLEHKKQVACFRNLCKPCPWRFPLDEASCIC